MKKASKSRISATVQLDARIDENDQLVVSFQEPGLERVPLRPDRSLQDLVAAHPGKKSLTLEIRDFFQKSTVYEVYGVTLEDDGHTIAAHWERTQHGVHHTFEIASATDASTIKLVIGALPRRHDAAVPLPLAPRAASGSGPFPTEVDPPPHGTK
jgi:hypothetical protein